MNCIEETGKYFGFDRLSTKCEKHRFSHNLKQLTGFIDLHSKFKQQSTGFSFKDNEELLNQLKDLAKNIISKKEWTETSKRALIMPALKSLADQADTHINMLIQIAFHGSFFANLQLHLKP